jgi:hypothetical protein
MKATTGLLALGLFTLAGVVTISCGGSSDDGNNENGAGSSSAGKGTGGGSSGSSSTAGKTSSGGSGNSSGSSNGGTNANTGGSGPGAGGGPAVDIEDCDAAVVDGMTCKPVANAANTCKMDDTTYCTCAGNDPKWICTDLGDLGAGGNGGFGDVTCPASPKNGDDCTGIGVCPGSTTCGCVLGTVYCGAPQQ